MKHEHILAFWQSVEALTPQSVARLDPNNDVDPVYGLTYGPDCVLPWQSPSHTKKRIRGSHQWRYTAQCGVYSTETMVRLLVERIGKRSEDFIERSGDNTRLFDLSFDRHGYPLPDSFVLALSAWSAGQIMRDAGGVHLLAQGGISTAQGLPLPEHSIPEVRSGYAAFDEVSRALAQWVADELCVLRERNAPADSEWIAHLVDVVAKQIALPKALFDGNALAHIRAIQTKVQPDREDAPVSHRAKSDASDILASFFIEDISRVKSALEKGKVGKGLLQFLGGSKPKSKRIDVRDANSNQTIGEALAPQRVPAGRWPSDHALVFSQQLAVNAAWSELENGAGIFAVNGPPGTGKTTLLRDVVAAVVTKRAEALVNVGHSAFGVKESPQLHHQRRSTPMRTPSGVDHRNA